MPFISGSQSTAINLSQETQETSLTLFCKEVSQEVRNPFPPSRWSESFFPLSGILFHTLFSPHRLCPLPCLIHHRLWAREKQDTQERSACKGQNWNIQRQECSWLFLCTLARKLYKAAPFPSTTSWARLDSCLMQNHYLTLAIFTLSRCSGKIQFNLSRV